MKPSTPTNGGVTLRAALIGTLFIPMNVYLVVQWETVWGTQYPTTMSIFFNAIFSLFILSILNFGLRRAFPRNAPSQGEMLTVYVVMITAVAVSGHDFTQTVFCTLGTASWYATPENEWNVLFGRHVPTWLTVNDPAILTPFYEGDATVLDARQLRGWALPVVAWTVFFTAFAFTALCLNVLVRRQWMEHEKLTYPLTQLPFEMTQENPLAFYMRPALWVGFGIGAG
ncbi:MAG: hypothetical protein O3A46_13195, partial [Candidatus Poribacteria bacterium]|nr:hypothetical protein [Candidatus Poribacteria bacterium]